MERADWLKQMRRMAERLYDHFSPLYWVTFGFSENATHRAYLQKFLERVEKGGAVLSAGCGAGRYEGMLLDAGHSVVGIDQSAGMLRRAKEHFPQVRYEKMGLQEMNFHEAFDGAICIEAMEHVSPEDWPGILRGFHEALKPGGVLYITVDIDSGDLEAAYQKAQAQGLPVVFGEVVDQVNVSYEKAMALDQGQVPDDLGDSAVYHFYPSLDQVRAWIDQASLEIEEEGAGSGYHHFVARKRKE